MTINRREFLSKSFLLTATATLSRPANGFGQSARARGSAMKAIESFKKVRRIKLVNLFTQIEKCERLSKQIQGAPNIFIKRDDCTGYLVGGNKLRKLEYVMADVLDKKATTVITVGGIQSNHARITAMVARRLGLNCHLILNGEAQREPRANFHLDKLMGVEIHTVSTRAERNEMMERLAADLEKRGERVYKVPLGASNHVGALGLVAALEEVVAQQKQIKASFDWIVTATSSGGTQAGLEAGKKLFGLSGLKILGISPDDTTDDIKGYIVKAANPLLSNLGVNEPIDRAGLLVDDSYVGAGYRIPSDKSKEAEQVFNETEGILLDPVYTAKAAAGLIDYCRRGKFKPGENVLFWHTGGLVALFE
jgi:L-cysteate sulfo-lyase